MPKVILHDRLGNKEEVDSSELSFRPSVYGILAEDGKVLLSKQWDGYDWPGGGIDIHETITEALKREFWEETGLNIEPKEIIMAQSSFYNSRRGEKWNTVLLYYLCEKVGGELSVGNATGSETDYIGMPEWIEIAEIKKLKFYNPANNQALIEVVKRFL